MIITDRNKIYMSNTELKEAIVAYIRLKHGEKQPIAMHIEKHGFSFGWNPENPAEYMISLKEALNIGENYEQKSTTQKISKKKKVRIEEEKDEKKKE